MHRYQIQCTKNWINILTISTQKRNSVNHEKLRLFRVTAMEKNTNATIYRMDRRNLKIEAKRKKDWLSGANNVVIINHYDNHLVPFRLTWEIMSHRNRYLKRNGKFHSDLSSPDKW